MAENNLTVGTTLEYGDTPTQLMQVRSFGFGGEEGETITTTDMDDTDGYQRKEQGMINPGTLEATVKYDPDNHADIRSQLGKNQAWIINFKDGSKWECDGFLNSIGFEFGEADSDGLVTNTLTVELSGVPTYTDTTS